MSHKCNYNWKIGKHKVPVPPVKQTWTEKMFLDEFIVDEVITDPFKLSEVDIYFIILHSFSSQ